MLIPVVHNKYCMLSIIRTLLQCFVNHEVVTLSKEIGGFPLPCCHFFTSNSTLLTCIPSSVSIQQFTRGTQRLPICSSLLLVQLKSYSIDIPHVILKLNQLIYVSLLNGWRFQTTAPDLEKICQVLKWVENGSAVCILFVCEFTFAQTRQGKKCFCCLVYSGGERLNWNSVGVVSNSRKKEVQHYVRKSTLKISRFSGGL